MTAAALNARRASVGYQYAVAQAAVYAQLGEAAFLASCRWRDRAPRVASWLQRRRARWYATAREHASRALNMLDSPPNRA